MIFAAKNSLIQVARDTARWAATQTFTQCSDAASGALPPLVDQADQIAQSSSLIGYSAGKWTEVGNFTADAYNKGLLVKPLSEGVEVVWSYESGGTCPPKDNIKAAYVTIRVTHHVPVFLPGLQYLPGLGTCDDLNGCYISLGSTSEFRMEPPRQ